MKLRYSTVVPTEGQYIAYWFYRGQIWSETFKVIDGIHCTYCNKKHTFIRSSESDNPDITYHYLTVPPKGN